MRKWLRLASVAGLAIASVAAQADTDCQGTLRTLLERKASCLEQYPGDPSLCSNPGFLFVPMQIEFADCAYAIAQYCGGSCLTYWDVDTCQSACWANVPAGQYGSPNN